MNHLKFLNLAFEVATGNPKVARASVAAVLVDKNNIISIGHNSYKTHPLVAKCSKNPWSMFLHAESTAIIKALKHLSAPELMHCTLYVCRAKMHGHELGWGMSRPCTTCQNFLRIFPVKTCYYSTEIRDIYEKMSVKESKNGGKSDSSTLQDLRSA